MREAAIRGLRLTVTPTRPTSAPGTVRVSPAKQTSKSGRRPGRRVRRPVLHPPGLDARGCTTSTGSPPAAPAARSEPPLPEPEPEPEPPLLGAVRAAVAVAVRRVGRRGLAFLRLLNRGVLRRCGGARHPRRRVGRGRDRRASRERAAAAARPRARPRALLVIFCMCSPPRWDGVRPRLRTDPSPLRIHGVLPAFAHDRLRRGDGPAPPCVAMTRQEPVDRPPGRLAHAPAEEPATVVAPSAGRRPAAPARPPRAARRPRRGRARRRRRCARAGLPRRRRAQRRSAAATRCPPQPAGPRRPTSARSTRRRARPSSPCRSSGQRRRVRHRLRHRRRRHDRHQRPRRRRRDAARRCASTTTRARSTADGRRHRPVVGPRRAASVDPGAAHGALTPLHARGLQGRRRSATRRSPSATRSASTAPRPPGIVSGLGREIEAPNGFRIDEVHPDRRADQPRQLGRPAARRRRGA